MNYKTLYYGIILQFCECLYNFYSIHFPRNVSNLAVQTCRFFLKIGMVQRHIIFTLSSKIMDFFQAFRKVRFRLYLHLQIINHESNHDFVILVKQQRI